MTDRYIFLGVKSKPFVRSYVAWHFLLFIVYLLLRFPAWLIPGFVFIGHFLYAVGSMGVIRVVKEEGGKFLVIRKLFRVHRLTLPLRSRLWWSYLFESAVQLTDLDKVGTIGNDLLVHLEVTDSHGELIVFQEYIGFDSRFPNDLEHSEEFVPAGRVIVRVQRVDKLSTFLQRVTEEGTS